MMIRQWTALLVLVTVVLGGCIWIDDNDRPGRYYDDEERVIYINRTGCVVDNYIDGEFVGSVSSFGTLDVFSRTLDGRHEFYSTCRDGSLTWGPTFFTLYDGETFRIYLEEGGMNFSTSR